MRGYFLLPCIYSIYSPSPQISSYHRHFPFLIMTTRMSYNTISNTGNQSEGGRDCVCPTTFNSNSSRLCLWKCMCKYLLISTRYSLPLLPQHLISTTHGCQDSQNCILERYLLQCTSLHKVCCPIKVDNC